MPLQLEGGELGVLPLVGTASIAVGASIGVGVWRGVAGSTRVGASEGGAPTSVGGSTPDGGVSAAFLVFEGPCGCSGPCRFGIVDASLTVAFGNRLGREHRSGEPFPKTKLTIAAQYITKCRAQKRLAGLPRSPKTLPAVKVIPNLWPLILPALCAASKIHQSITNPAGGESA